jgi:hypothetical protein
MSRNFYITCTLVLIFFVCTIFVSCISLKHIRPCEANLCLLQEKRNHIVDGNRIIISLPCKVDTVSSKHKQKSTIDGYVVMKGYTLRHYIGDTTSSMAQNIEMWLQQINSSGITITLKDTFVIKNMFVSKADVKAAQIIPLEAILEFSEFDSTATGILANTYASSPTSLDYSSRVKIQSLIERGWYVKEDDFTGDLLAAQFR